MGTAEPKSSRESEDYSTVTLPGDADRRIAYAEYGSPDGVPVVFLHGIPGSRRLGRLLDTAAAERDVRVLAPDRPGYGQSERWPDRSIQDAGTIVSAVLDDAGERAAGLVAFSGGSAHALATAATHPDRVDRVDIVSGAPPPSCSEQTPAAQRLFGGLATTAPSVLGGLFRGYAWLAERRDPSFVTAQYTDPEALPAETARVVRDDFLEAIDGGASGVVTEFRNTAAGWGIDYGEIEPPVSVWHGEDDTNVPIDDARRLAERIPTAQVTVLEGKDHLQTLRRSAPEILAAHGQQASPCGASKDDD